MDVAAELRLPTLQEESSSLLEREIYFQVEALAPSQTIVGESYLGPRTENRAARWQGLEFWAGNGIFAITEIRYRGSPKT